MTREGKRPRTAGKATTAVRGTHTQAHGTTCRAERELMAAVAAMGGLMLATQLPHFIAAVAKTVM